VGGHDDRVHLVYIVVVVLQVVQKRQQEGSGFSRSGLGASDHIFSVEDNGDGLFLYGRSLFKVHGL